MLELAFAYIVSITPAKIITPPEEKKIEIVQGESEYNRVQREEREKREEELKKRTVRSSPAYSSYTGVEVIGESYEQCVETYKRLSGRSRSLGYAGNIPSQGDTPVVGAGALWLNYGHIGYVTAVDDDIVTVIDSNWVKGKLTRHTLSIDNFRGFIYN